MGYCEWISSANNAVGLSSTTVSASSNAPDHPGFNIQSSILTKTWRSQETIITFTLALGVSFPADFVAIVNHNLTPDAVIIMRAGNTSGAADYATQIPWGEKIAYAKTVGTQNYPFWVIDINDSANPDGYIEIGYAFIGMIVMPQTYSWRYGGNKRLIATNLEGQSPLAVPFCEFMYSIEELVLDFGPISQTQMQYLVDLNKDSGYGRYPLLFIPDADRYEAFYVRITSNFDQKLHVQATTSQRYVQLTFLEDSYGKRS